MIVSITLISALSLAVALMSLVDRQIMKGVTYKEVDLAAWVQAVGSVLAILATAASVWWAHHLERVRAKTAVEESTALRIEYVCTAMDEGLEMVKAVQKGLGAESGLDEEHVARTMHLVANSLQAWAAAFREVSISTLPTPKAFRPILQYGAALSECLRLLTEPPPLGGYRAGRLRTDIERHIARLESARTQFTKAVEELPKPPARQAAVH